MENENVNKKQFTKTRTAGYIVCAVFSGVAFSLLCVFLSVYMVAFNRAIYHNSMVRAEAELYNSHGLAQDELDYVIDDVLKYLVDGREFMDTPMEGYEGELFSETEISHMVDVKAIFTAIKWITIACAVLVPLAFAGMILLNRERYKKKHKKFFLYTVIGNGAFIGVILLLMLIDFNWAFNQFHYLFFSNLDWQLSSTDLLIEMLPENLFMRLGIFISLTYVSLMLIFFLAGHFQKKIARFFKRIFSRGERYT